MTKIKNLCDCTVRELIEDGPDPQDSRYFYGMFGNKFCWQAYAVDLEYYYDRMVQKATELEESLIKAEKQLAKTDVACAVIVNVIRVLYGLDNEVKDEQSDGGENERSDS